MGDHLLVRACRGEPVQRTPVWAMRQAGRWDPEFRRLRGRRGFYEFSRSVDLAAAASLLPRRFGVDAIILFYDITTLAAAMGLEFELRPERGPVPKRPVRSRAAAAELAARPDPDRYGHLLELLRRVRNELAGTLPVLVFASAPFTLACYCVSVGKDVAGMRQFIAEQPETWSLLADRIAEATVEFIGTLCRAGADAYQLFDSWAGRLSRQEYEQWAQPYHRQILTACRAVPSLLFVRECPYLDLMAGSGANVISLGTRHDLSEARRRYPHLTFQGNVDNRLLATGTPERVREAALRCLSQGGGQRHILNLNHGVRPNTPVANFTQFVAAALP